MIREQAPILLLLAPFICAMATGLIGSLKPKAGWPLALAGTALSLAGALVTLFSVWSAPAHKITYRLGGWAPPQGIEYVVDPLNALILVLVAAVSLLTVIYSKPSVERELPHKKASFYTLLLLLTSGLLGMAVTGDAFNLYVLLEITSLSSYALIAMGPGRAAFSCFNYIIMGTIGASFYLLGVGYLYIKTGSLNMHDISRIIAAEGLWTSPSVHIGFLLILIGVWIKMAFFPLHRWLPNAYTYAPSASSSLIAPLVTKVSIYVMIRFMYTVFTPGNVFDHILRERVVVWIAVTAILTGSFFALSKTNFKGMISYLVIAEVGYMVGGAWLANRQGLTGAIFHLVSDALMTFCFFLFAGILMYRRGECRLNSFRGLFKTMPWTMAGFTTAAFSMIGIPPTCGFFSKWYLIGGGISAGYWEFVAALLISSLVNAVLFFKLIEKAFFESGPEPADPAQPTPAVAVKEGPWLMVAPLLTVAAGLVLLGVFSQKVISFVSLYVATTGL